jgi:multicomponent Na+:H+ antiporter subunit G
MIGQAMVLGGAVLILLAGVGVVRLRDTLARMHALAKATTLGLILVLGGTALVLENINDVTSLLLAMALQVLTSPVGTNLMAATIYAAPGIPHILTSTDELAERERGPAPPPG